MHWIGEIIYMLSTFYTLAEDRAIDILLIEYNCHY
jgi:hypothetical protein